MLHLDEDALGVLRYLTLDDDAATVARRFYGHDWHEPIRSGHDRIAYRATRNPLPGIAAEALAEVLSGVVCHDGRASHRESRAAGWWTRSASGDWSSPSLDEIVSGLARPVRDLHAEAAEAADLARVAYLAEVRRIGESRASTSAAAEAARSTSLRRAVLHGLSVMLDAHGRNASAMFGALRASLPMPGEALDAIAARWLSDALDLGDVAPDARGRLMVADVRVARDRGEGLPVQTLFSALDRILGKRQSNGAARFWRMPVEAVEDALDEGRRPPSAHPPPPKQTHP